ncbi:unnamed protein product [Psylliodes chrysocephalus]|uniref:Uncharacterized protein n=1 Tax=Psylliodes chrysocephalus TaxID=3402493 RepID=A0A9P0CWZ4_9CUCU|nr:unnamed protein product [Psylliodes chrysocephala]
MCCPQENVAPQSKVDENTLVTLNSKSSSGSSSNSTSSSDSSSSNDSSTDSSSSNDLCSDNLDSKSDPYGSDDRVADLPYNPPEIPMTEMIAEIPTNIRGAKSKVKYHSNNEKNGRKRLKHTSKKLRQRACEIVEKLICI